MIQATIEVTSIRAHHEQTNWQLFSDIPQTLISIQKLTATCSHAEALTYNKTNILVSYAITTKLCIPNFVFTHTKQKKSLTQTEQPEYEPLKSSLWRLGLERSDWCTVRDVAKPPEVRTCVLGPSRNYSPSCAPVQLYIPCYDATIQANICGEIPLSPWRHQEWWTGWETIPWIYHFQTVTLIFTSHAFCRWQSRAREKEWETREPDNVFRNPFFIVWHGSCLELATDSAYG